MEVGNEYQAFYKEMHNNESLYSGSALVLHADSIRQLIEQFNPTTLLDYGCGKGNQYTEDKIHQTHFRGVMPTLYDFAVEAHSVLPRGGFDGVISTDVLEHIPEDQLDNVLSEIFSKADKFVYLGICTVPADSFLPNGENSHVTVKPFEWWYEKIMPYSSEVYTMIYTYGSTRGTAILNNNKVILKKER